MTQRLRHCFVSVCTLCGLQFPAEVAVLRVIVPCAAVLLRAGTLCANSPDASILQPEALVDVAVLFG